MDLSAAFSSYFFLCFLLIFFFFLPYFYFWPACLFYLGQQINENLQKDEVAVGEKQQRPS